QGSAVRASIEHRTVALRTVTPRRQDLGMSDHQAPPSLADLPEDVVEPWWCPVCDAPAHRTLRPGRPKLYCSNACRQRAYRWGGDTRGGRGARACRPGACGLVPLGRGRAWGSRGDFGGTLGARRNRQPTLCGAFARPATLLPNRTHHQFVPVSGYACKTCVT